MNPNQAFANRTARLVAENKRPVFSTETRTPASPVERDHQEMVQVSDFSGQWWSGPFQSRQMSGVLEQYASYGYDILDIDCSSKCWCAK